MNLLKTFWICCFIAVPNIILSQVSQPLNVGGAGDYLGWDATVSNDLRIRHEGTRPIIFSTNNTERMRVFNGNTAIGTTSVPPNIRCSIFQDNGLYGILGINNSILTTIANYYGFSSDKWS